MRRPDLLVPRLIAHFSLIGLDGGDIITTGSPAGVAIAMPDLDAYYRQPGDVVRATVMPIGALETTIV